MIRRYLAYAALCGALALAGAALWQRGTIAKLEGQNASLTRSVAALELSREQAKLARAVEAARASSEAARAAESRQLVERILTTEFGGCADETLDPDLADLLRGLPGAD